VGHHRGLSAGVHQFCLAQTVPAKENTHRSYDQRARECKKQGNEQQLKGEELRSYIANCMKG
jgi:hypothetical protein